jgi:hypothetical protein
MQRVSSGPAPWIVILHAMDSVREAAEVLAAALANAPILGQCMYWVKCRHATVSVQHTLINIRRGRHVVFSLTEPIMSEYGFKYGGWQVQLSEKSGSGPVPRPTVGSVTGPMELFFSAAVELMCYV